MLLSDSYPFLQSLYAKPPTNDENDSSNRGLDLYPAQSHALRQVIENTDWVNAEWEVRHLEQTIYVVFFGPWPMYTLVVEPYQRGYVAETEHCTAIDSDASFIASLDKLDSNAYGILKLNGTLDPRINSVDIGFDLSGESIPIWKYHAAILLNGWFSNLVTTTTIQLRDDMYAREDLLQKLMDCYLSHFAMDGKLGKALALFGSRLDTVIVTENDYLSLIYDNILDLWSGVLVGTDFEPIADHHSNLTLHASAKTLIDHFWKQQIPNNSILIASYENVGFGAIVVNSDRRKLGVRFYAPCHEYIGYFDTFETVKLESSRRINNEPTLYPIHTPNGNYHMAWNVSFCRTANQAPIRNALESLLLDKVRAVIDDPESYSKNDDLWELLRSYNPIHLKPIKLERPPKWKPLGRYGGIVRAISEPIMQMNQMIHSFRKANINFGLPLYLLPEIFNYAEDASNHPAWNFVANPDNPRSIDLYCSGFPLYTLVAGTVHIPDIIAPGTFSALNEGTEYYGMTWYIPTHIPKEYRVAYRMAWLVNVCARFSKKNGVEVQRTWLRRYSDKFSIYSFTGILGRLNKPVITMHPAREILMLDMVEHTVLTSFGTTMRKTTLDVFKSAFTLRQRTVPKFVRGDFNTLALLAPHVRYMPYDDEFFPFLLNRVTLYGLRERYYSIRNLPLAWHLTFPPDVFVYLPPVNPKKDIILEEEQRYDWENLALLDENVPLTQEDLDRIWNQIGHMDY